MNKNDLYRSIPKVDALLEEKDIQALETRYGHEVLITIIREETDRLRCLIADTTEEEQAGKEIARLPERIAEALDALHRPRVRRVINATGTILHTNLGRAVMKRESADLLAALVSGYSNLEYNLEAGARGERYSHFEKLLCRLTGAEAAMVVNNNAAAVMLALSALCAGGEVIVSRGELVEIGGKFRVPDVCAQSGAKLVEIGTTNKTHLDDYEHAVTEETRAILKVHKSNFAIIGFSEEVALQELKPLSEAKQIPLIEDLGSGSLVDLKSLGVAHPEPTVQESIANGADVVCFSGDKLLGGPQAGIIIGKKEYIAKMKKHPLTRALRVDKFTVTALELTLLEYLYPDRAVKEIPVLRMIGMTQEETRERAERLAALLRNTCKEAEITTEACVSQIGGGALPMEQLDSTAVRIRPAKLSTVALEERMRGFAVPVVGRTVEDAVRLDVRTMLDADFEAVAEMMGTVLS